MRFTVDETLPGSVDEVLAAFVDPVFLATLTDLPTVAAPEVLDQQRDGDVVRQRLRYRFTGHLSSAVTAVIDRDKLVWVDDHTYDLAAGTGSFRILPEQYGDRIEAGGTERFTAAGGRTRWTLDAELRVHWPVVGRLVENAIVSGLRDTLANEAACVGAWLSR